MPLQLFINYYAVILNIDKKSPRFFYQYYLKIKVILLKNITYLKMKESNNDFAVVADIREIFSSLKFFINILLHASN